MNDKRPRYVTAGDVANETAAAAKLVEWFKSKFWITLTVQMSAPGFAFDFLLRNETGRPEGMFEYKRRKGWSTQYDTWHISKHKLESLRVAGAAMQVPVCLVFEWDDGIYIANLKQLGSTSEKIGGRYDRGDAHDQEVMIDISRTVFLRVA